MQYTDCASVVERWKGLSQVRSAMPCRVARAYAVLVRKKYRDMTDHMRQKRQSEVDSFAILKGACCRQTAVLLGKSTVLYWCCVDHTDLLRVMHPICGEIDDVR